MKFAQAVIDPRLADAEHLPELHNARTRLFKTRLGRLAQSFRQSGEAALLPLQHFNVVELAASRIHSLLQIRRLTVDEAVDL